VSIMIVTRVDRGPEARQVRRSRTSGDHTHGTTLHAHHTAVIRPVTAVTLRSDTGG